MRIRFSPLALALTLSGLMSLPVFATTATPTKGVKKHRTHHVQPTITPATPTEEAAYQPRVSPLYSNAELVAIAAAEEKLLPFDLDVPGVAFVSTGPYVGVPIQFAGSDLIVNSPSVNTDVKLLTIRESITQKLNEKMVLPKSDLEQHSHVLLSGLIEAQGNYIDHGGAPSTSDIDLSSFSLDVTVFGPSRWLQGFVELNYDDNAPIGTSFASTSNYRFSNSRIYLNKGFITIGDFSCSPFYSTVGQFYVPFGKYSSVMVSDTLPKLIGRTKARSLLVGYQQQVTGPFMGYASAFIFRGDSHAASVSKINNGGLNTGFRFDTGFINGDIGGGVIGNIADSGGMQLGTGFEHNEQIVHRVPAYDLRATVSVGPHIDLITEYVRASTHFNVNDMSFQGHGALPSAMDAEASYSFSFFDKPSSIGIGYGKSYQSQAMQIPLRRESLVLNTSWLRNTLQSLEFRRDRQYAASVVSTGAGDTAVAAATGKNDFAVTAQFDYYF